jgi:hypothetical protein
MNIYSESLSVNISKGMKRKLISLSKTEDMKLSSVVRKMLKEGISSHEEKENSEIYSK